MADPKERPKTEIFFNFLGVLKQKYVRLALF